MSDDKTQPMNATAKHVPIEDLTPDPGNARQGDVAAIRASLARFGQTKPIVVSESGVILAGNHTWLAARALGWDEIWVSVVGLDDLEGEAYAVADNEIARLGSIDEGLQGERVRRIAEREDLLTATGLGSERLGRLQGLEVRGDASAVPERAKTPAERAELYEVSGVRSLVLPLAEAEFKEAVELLKDARAELELDSNAEVFLALLRARQDVS